MASGLGRDEVKSERTGEFCFFTMEKLKLRYIFGGLDSDAKPKKRIRSTRSSRSSFELKPLGPIEAVGWRDRTDENISGDVAGLPARGGPAVYQE
jgi:hypothetical protein